MYESHFGLRQRPFPAVPDPTCYFSAASHDQALGMLGNALGLGEGVALLTADAGLGKTLLIHCLVDRLPKTAVSVVLTGGRLRDATALFQAILFDLSLPFEGRSEQELRLVLMDALLKTFKDGAQTIVFVDEAHHLSAELLEELRLLGNLEARGGKALQTILAGLPPLLSTLRRSNLEALRQRLAVRATLEPFTQQEARDYLVQAVERAGGTSEDLFMEESLDLLAQETRGVPRLLNQAAHQALLLAFQAAARCVDGEAAHGALEILGLVDQTDGLGDETELPAIGQNAGELLPLGGGEEPTLEEMPGIAPRRFANPARPA